MRGWVERKVKAQPIHRKHTLTVLRRPSGCVLFRDIQVITSTCPYDGHKNATRERGTVPLILNIDSRRK